MFPQVQRWAGWLLGRSLDYLVGAGEQRRRNIEAERLRGLKIDDQLELGGLHAPNVAISARARVAGREAAAKALRMIAQPATARRTPGVCAAGPDETEAAMTSSV